MAWLLDPLPYNFMRNALMAGVLVGALCPVIGSYLIVQHMEFLGHVIAYALLPGLEIALIMFGIFLAALLLSPRQGLLIRRLRSR